MRKRRMVSKGEEGNTRRGDKAAMRRKRMMQDEKMGKRGDGKLAKGPEKG